MDVPTTYSLNFFEPHCLILSFLTHRSKRAILRQLHMHGQQHDRGRHYRVRGGGHHASRGSIALPTIHNYFEHQTTLAAAWGHYGTYIRLARLIFDEALYAMQCQLLPQCLWMKSISSSGPEHLWSNLIMILRLYRFKGYFKRWI